MVPIGSVRPRRMHRDEGKPEEQVEVCPEHCGAGVGDGVEEMVVIVPIDGDVEEAEKHREDCRKRCPVGTFGHFEFKHHHRDDDGEDSVGEGFEAVLLH